MDVRPHDTFVEDEANTVGRAELTALAVAHGAKMVITDKPLAHSLAEAALNQILAYTPLVPNFAWHGSAYGFGDFGNNGFVRFDGGSERSTTYTIAGHRTATVKSVAM